MASTYTDIGTELMTTGENAGNWGTKTNTNLQILEEALRGYVSQSIAGGAQTTALTYTDGTVGDAARNMIIALTGSITGNQVVTVTAKEKLWIVDNQTSGAYTVQFMVSGQTGVTWAATDKGTKILYCNGTDVIDTDIGGVGAYDLNGGVLTLDADADTTITADTDDQIDIRIGGTDQITIKDGALSPVTTNDIDLGTSSLEFKDAFFDGTVTSDAFAGPLTGNVTGNASGTAATVTTAAQSNITSLGTLTTLTVDNVIVNGTTIGHTDDTDLITLADGVATVAGELDAATLDISGNADIDGTTNLDAVDIDGAVQLDATLTIGANDQGYDVILYGDTASANLTWDTSVDDLILNGAARIVIPDGQLVLGSTAVTTTAAELNLIDGGASTGTTAVADADGILTNDGGTMRLTTAATFKTYFSSGAASSVAADDISAGDAAVTLGNGSTSADVTIDSGDDVVIDAAGGNVEFKDAGTLQLALDMDGTAGVQIIKLGVDADDLVFQQYDGTEVMRVEDGAYLNVSNTTASSSSTTGSAIFGGGIGVAADANIGDDLTLRSDSAVLGFGADLDTSLTHTDGTGLTLNSTNKLCFNDASQFIQGSSATVLSIGATNEIDLTATAVDLNGTLDVSGNSQFSGTVTVGVDDTGLDVKLFGASAGAYLEWDESADQLRIMGASADATTSTGKLLLATSLTDINANDVLGKIDFQAPHEAGGTDAITVAASIQALAQGTFSSSVNATDLIFYTGHSEAATEKFRFTSQGELGVGGANYGSDGQVLTSTGAGTAPAWEAAAGGGKILQAVGASDTTARTHGSASFSKASNTLDCAITPSSSSSKIFVSCSVGVYSNGDFSCSIFRDTTNLGEAQDGKARIIGKSQFGGGLLDSPSTTSEVTYSFQVNAIDSQTVSINYEGATAHMLVMEVGP